MSLTLARIVSAGALAAALFAASPASAQPPASSWGDEELAGGDEAQEGETDEAPAARRPRGRPRIEVTPYVELNAGVSADLSNDDVLTYSSVAAGVDARVETRRVQAQASYRYERRIAIDGDGGEDDVHSGIAMIHAEAVPGVSLDAGAMATRSGGAGRGTNVTPFDDSTQVYSAYAGPTVNTNVGPVQIGASYRIGYVHVDDDGLAGDGTDGRYNDSTAHNATASVGMSAGGRLPFGWTVGGGYVREEAGELENRFEASYLRGDLVVPVGPTLALTGGVGYEDISSSSMDIVRNAAGVPVLVNGRLVADPTRPRVQGFDTSGVIFDGGIIWRPSPRTELQARAGRRYGGTTVTGSLSHRFNSRYGMSASVYDSIGTFGTALVNNISSLPANATIDRNPLTGNISSCVYGRDPGTGVCFDQALQSLSGQAYRGRGANLSFSGTAGLYSFGLGAGYSHRRYIQPVSGDMSSLDPRVDQSVGVSAGLSRRLGRFAGASLDLSASWYDSDRPLFEPVMSQSATFSFHRSFLLERLRFNAALGIYHTDGMFYDSTVLSAIIGLSYTF